MDRFHLADRPPVAQAIEAAAACSTLDELDAAIRAYDGHDLARERPFLPSHRSPHENPIMIIAEKPETNDDLAAGKPFSGAHGKVMREVCGWYDMDVDQMHVEYAVHWEPHGDKPLNATMISASRPFLFRAIELVQPRVIIAPGRGVLESLFMFRGGVLSVVGHSMAWKRGDLEITAFATLHPAYPLRVPTAKFDLAQQVETAAERYGLPDGTAYDKLMRRVARAA